MFYRIRPSTFFYQAHAVFLPDVLRVVGSNLEGIDEKMFQRMSPLLLLELIQG